jgi:hypothetical protein
VLLDLQRSNGEACKVFFLAAKMFFMGNNQGDIAVHIVLQRVISSNCNAPQHIQSLNLLRQAFYHEKYICGDKSTSSAAVPVKICSAPSTSKATKMQCLSKKTDLTNVTSVYSFSENHNHNQSPIVGSLKS